MGYLLARELLLEHEKPPNISKSHTKVVIGFFPDKKMKTYQLAHDFFDIFVLFCLKLDDVNLKFGI